MNNRKGSVIPWIGIIFVLIFLPSLLKTSKISFGLLSNPIIVLLLIIALALWATSK